VAKVKYLGTTINQELHSIQEMLATILSLLPSHLLSKNLKIKVYKTIILYGCETWSLTLREEHRLRMCEYRVLKKNIWTYEGGSGRRLKKTT
jgi:hypothetical protein